MMIRTWYTQREWDRVVGWGTVPREYMKDDVDSLIILKMKKMMMNKKTEEDDDEQENRSADEDTVV